MFESCLAKQNALKKLFGTCATEDAKYAKIIDLGKELKPLSNEKKVPENLVPGCQSKMFLHSSFDGINVLFEGESDALISAGLAAILLKVYNGEAPETILKCPPTYLEELGISASLTPSRANGLYSIHLRMKQDALKWLIAKDSRK